MRWDLTSGLMLKTKVRLLTVCVMPTLAVRYVFPPSPNSQIHFLYFWKQAHLNIHCDNVERSESGMYFFAYDFSQATVCKLLHKVPWYSLTAPEAQFLIDPVSTITAIGQKMRELWNEWFGACVFWPGTGESV